MKNLLKVLGCGILVYLGILILLALIFPAGCLGVQDDCGMLMPRVVTFTYTALSPTGFGILIIGLMIGYVIVRKQHGAIIK